MKILLVEDDRLLAQEIARALREENFAVDVAANGEDGQRISARPNPTTPPRARSRPAESAWHRRLARDGASTAGTCPC